MRATRWAAIGVTAVLLTSGAVVVPARALAASQGIRRSSSGPPSAPRGNELAELRRALQESLADRSGGDDVVPKVELSTDPTGAPRVTAVPRRPSVERDGGVAATPPAPTPPRPPPATATEPAPVALEPTVVDPPTCTVSWDGGAGTLSWHDALNWSTNSVPGAGSVACVSAPVTFSSGSSTIAGLNVTGSLTLTGGTLTVTGPSTATRLNLAGGRLDATGEIDIGTALDFSSGVLGGAGTVLLLAGTTSAWGTGGDKHLSTTLVNQGTVNWTGGRIPMRSDFGGVAVFDNRGTFTTSANNQMDWCCGGAQTSLVNSGVFTVTSGQTSLVNVAYSDVAGADVVVDAGAALRLDGASSTATVAGEVSGGGELRMVAEAFSFTGLVTLGSMAVSGGSVAFAAGSSPHIDALGVSGGSVTIDTDDDKVVLGLVDLTGGTLGGTTNVAPVFDFAWSSGVLAGPGSLTVLDDVTATLDTGGDKHLSTTLVNEGTVNWTGGRIPMRSDFGGVGVFDNRGTFTTSANNQMDWCCGGAQTSLVNSGQLRVLSGQTSLVNVAYSDGAGAGVVVDEGAALRLDGASSTTTVAAEVSGGGELRMVAEAFSFTGLVTLGSMAVSGGSVAFPAGSSPHIDALGVSGGSVTIDTDEDLVVLGLVDLTGGSIGGTTSLMPLLEFGWSSGVLAGPGMVTIPDGVTATLDTGGDKHLSTRLVNEGTLNWTGGRIPMRSDFGGIGIINNNGTFTTSANNQMDWCCGGSQTALVNTGTFTVASGQTSLVNVVVMNSGSMSIGLGAALRLDGASSPTTVGGLVAGPGELRVVADAFSFTGSVDLGSISVSGGSVAFPEGSTLAADGFGLSGGTVTIDAVDEFVDLGALGISGGTFGGTTNVAPTFAFSWSSGMLAGPGMMTIGDGITATLDTGGDKHLSTRLVNEGTLNWTGGRIPMRSDLGGIGIINNNGTFTTSANNQMDWCCGGSQTALVNTGTFTVASGQTSLVNVVVMNSGSMSIGLGAALRLDGAPSPTTVDGLVSGLGELRLVADAFSFTGTVAVGSVAVSGGTVAFAAGSSLSADGFGLSGGTVTVDALDELVDLGALGISGGTFGGSTNVAPTFAFNWSSGVLAGPGTLTIAEGLTATLDTGGDKHLSTRFVNEGTVNWTGGRIPMRSDLGGVGVVDNRGTFTTSANNQMDWCCGGAQTSLVNTGTFTVASGQTSLVNVGLTNTGSISIGLGTALRLDGASPPTTVDGLVSGLGELRLVADAFSFTGTVAVGSVAVSGGSVAFAAGSSLSADGFGLSGGTVTVDALDELVDLGALGISGGTFGGSTNVAPTFAFNWSSGVLAGPGTMTIAEGITATLDTGGDKHLSTRLVNEGTLNWTGGRIPMRSDMGGIGVIDNAGTWNMSANNQADWCCGPTRTQIINRAGGAINQLSGTTAFNNASLDNQGRVLVVGGALDDNGPLANASGSTLTGGDWEVADGAVLRLRTLGGLGTNDAIITLRGSGQLLDGANLDQLRMLTTNTGIVRLVDGADRGLTLPLENRGTVVLGQDSTLFLADSYAQTQAGTLQVAVAGPTPGAGTGQLQVDGPVDLDGTLIVTTVAPFVAGSQEVTVVDGTSLSGVFDTVDATGWSAEYRVAGGDVVLVGEGASVPAVVVAPQSFGESAGTAVITVSGVGGNVPVTLPVTFLDGTAVSPADYQGAPQQVTVPPNGTVVVPVPLTADALDEADETFTVSVGGTSASMTIVDDDPLPGLRIEDATAFEGDTTGTPSAGPAVELTVRLVDATGFIPTPSGRSVTVFATTSDGTALEDDDYVGLSIPVTIAPGETTATVRVPLVGDLVDEDEESFTVTLATPDHATLVVGATSATATIIDDDGPVVGDDIGEQINAGTPDMVTAMRGWADAFDLDGFDLPAFGLPAFELPVVTDDLASATGAAAAVDTVDAPYDPVTGTLDEVLAQLEAAGVTVDWVEGGIGGRPSPTGPHDLFQGRFVATVADLEKAAGFTGDTYNDEAGGVLAGLASALGLDGDLTLDADLRVTLVFGVDDSGFYVAEESGLRLSVTAGGTVGGSGTVAGISGAAVDGTGHADLDVDLGATGGPRRLRAAQLGTDPFQLLRPSATGTADLDLHTAIAPTDLHWKADATVDAVGGHTSTTLVATVDGTVELPGLTDGATGDPATLAVHGTTDGSTWTLTGSGAADSAYDLVGIPITDVTVGATVSPTAVTGSAGATLHPDPGGGGHPLDLTVAGSFDHTTFHAEAHGHADQVSIGEPPLLYAEGLDLDLVVDGDVAAGTITGGLEVAADEIVIKPTTPLTDPVQGAGTATGVTGSLDGAGNLHLHADAVHASIGGALEVDGTAIDVGFGPDVGDPVFSLGTLTGTFPSFDGLEVDLTGLHMNRDGTFGATSVGVRSDGIAEVLGVADLLPFDIDAVTAEFPDHEDLDRFDLTVSGAFDLAALDGLPFDPIIGIGPKVVTKDTPAEDNRFTFTVGVDSLSAGQVHPEELGPITLGFENLEVGQVTIGAQLTLGGYQGGQWVDDFGGSLSILGGLDTTSGEATIDVDGSLDLDGPGATLDLTGTFTVSADLGDAASIEGASLDFGLGLHVGDDFSTTITGPTFSGAGIDRVTIKVGDLLRVFAEQVDIDFHPAAGEPLVAFGGTEGDGTLGVEFEEGAGPLAGWGGEAGNFGLTVDFEPILLPGFFVAIDVPPGEHFGLPDFLPLRVDRVGIRFPNIDPGSVPGGGIELDDAGAFAVIFSGGIEANDTWPITATVDGLEVDLGKLADGQFPITNLDGFMMGMEPFELVPGFSVGGGLGLGTLDVGGETVFYGRVFGEFEIEGIGAGIDLVVTQYGPVLAKLDVPLGIPLGPTGLLLAGVQGGLKFGGPAFPDPESPLEILHDPAFDTDFPITTDTIRQSVSNAVANESFTWDDGFTLALSANVIHVAAPGMISGEVTIGANIGLIPGQQGLKLIGSGNISIFGMPFADAAILWDFSDPIAPKYDLAFESPSVGNPLGFLLPAKGEFEVSIDTKGVALGTILGIRTFVEDVVAGGLDVGQDLFDSVLDELAARLEDDHDIGLARILLDLDGNGSVSESEDDRAIDRGFLIHRVLGLEGTPGLLPLGGDGLPIDVEPAMRATEALMREILATAADLTAGGGFDLSGVHALPDFEQLAQLLGPGSEAAVAMAGVVREAVTHGSEVFFDVFDPSFHLRGALQPVLLGIPFGAPEHQVELIINKDGLGFGFDTSLVDLTKKIADQATQFLPGVLSGLLSLMTLGFEDHLGMTVELPFTGIVETLVGGSALPTIDPFGGQWGIELRGGLKFLDFETGKLSGLIVPPGNRAFLDARVAKVWENPDAPVDPNRIPIQDEQRYEDIVRYGGILLTGQMLVPELLTDPVALLSELDLQVPDDPLDLPDWISAIADDLSRIDEPARVQAYIPGLTSVLTTNFDAADEADRIGFNTSGQDLLDKLNPILDAAYFEGTWDGKLLSVPVANGRLTVSTDGVEVESRIPTLGLTGTFLLDKNEVTGRDGEPVLLPRAGATIALDAADLAGVLGKFGLPTQFSPGTGATASARLLTPGYDPASDDLFERKGGIALDAHMAIDGLLDDASFHFAVTPPQGLAPPDFVAHAQVDDLGPLGGVAIHDASVDVTGEAGQISVAVDGHATILGVDARVHGDLAPDLTGQLSVDFQGGGPQLAGFDVDAGFVLKLTRNGVGQLQSVLTFDGELGLPDWLTAPGGAGTIHATGTLASNGTVSLTFAASGLSLFGFTLADGTLTVVGNGTTTRVTANTHLQYLGTTLGVTGSLNVTAAGPSGTLVVTLAGGASLAFGPVSVTGTLRLLVSQTSAALSVAGNVNIPGVANGVKVAGRLASDGTGSLSVTATSLTMFGFKLTPIPNQSPAVPLGSVVRTTTTTTLTVDARLALLGATLDVDGSLTLAPAGATGHLALAFASGSAPFTFGPVGLSATASMQLDVTPTAGSASFTAAAAIPGVANGVAVTATVASNGDGSLRVDATSLGVKGFTLTKGTQAGAPALASISKAGSTTTFTANARLALLGATFGVQGNLTLAPAGATGNLALTFASGSPTTLGFGPVALSGTASMLLAITPTSGSATFTASANIPGFGSGIAISATVAGDGTGSLRVDVASLAVAGFTLSKVGSAPVASVTRTTSATTITVDARLGLLGTTFEVDGTLTLSGAGADGSATLAIVTGSPTSLGFGPVTLTGSAAATLTIHPGTGSVGFTASANVPSLASGLSIAATVAADGTGSLALTGTSIGVKGFSVTRRPNATTLGTIVRTASATTMTLDARFSFLGNSLDVDGDLTLAAGGPTGNLALTFNGSSSVPFSGWQLEGGVKIAVTPTTGAISVISKVDVPGIANDLTITGSLDTSLLGSFTLSVGSLKVGGAASGLTVGGSFTLSRLVPSGGGSPVVSFGATNASLTWAGVTSFTVPTFTVASSGNLDVSVTGKTVTFGQLTLVLPSFTLHATGSPVFAELRVGSGSLSIGGIAEGTGKLTLPAFDIASDGSLSVVASATHLDLSALDLNGKLTFARSAAGVAKVSVTSTSAGPPTISVPALGTANLNAFDIASDGTFDVGLTVSRLGPAALSIRDASFRVKKTGASITTISLAVHSGTLYLPAGEPVNLPLDFSIDGDASWSQDVSLPSLNLGPAFKTSNDPSVRLSLSSGVFGISLVSPLSISASGSSGMSLTAFSVKTDGTFTGTLTGQLTVLGRTLASGTFTLTRSGGVVKLTLGSPKSVDLGPVSASVDGYIQSDGKFDLSGDASVNLTVLGVGLVGTAHARLRNTGLSGNFDGKACAGPACLNLFAFAVNSSGNITVTVAGITATFHIWDVPAVPADTIPPQLSQVSDISVTANVDSTNKMVVNYTKPTATDNRDSSPTVTCTPASGSAFNVGVTTVTCTAKDDANNTSSRSFKVTLVDDPGLLSSVVVAAGDSLLLDAGGFGGRTLVAGTLNSDPIALGSRRTDGEGVLHWRVTIPDEATPGTHHIVLAGVAPDGSPRLVVYEVRIQGSGLTATTTTTAPAGGTTPGGSPGSGTGPSPGSLVRTGSDLQTEVWVGAASLLLGLVLVTASRRRRRTDGPAHGAPGNDHR